MKAPTALLTRACTFETRAANDDDGHTLEGYAAVFDTPTRIDSWEGTFDEVIAPGAFAKTIRERKPVMQFDHGHDIATGSVPIGAFEELSEDDQGLFVRARLHDNARVEPIRQAIASGAIDGMSFRFRVIREEWDESGDTPVRTIREVELFEAGPVVFPAYAATSVGVRSLLADLSDPERTALVSELAAAVRGAAPDSAGAAPDSADAAHQGTSATTDDAAPQGTSSGKRAAYLRGLHPIVQENKP
jgi:HK97 family phage prohead protease